MLPLRSSGTVGDAAPALILMHFLGGSAREWDEVRNLLDPRYRCIALDLPGFGDAASIPGYTVAEMAEAVSQTIASIGLERFVLVGHSMSGKVAAVLASRRLPGLEALILVAPSPPSPEPIAHDKRATMIETLGQPHPDDEIRANRYVTKNESRVMPAPIQQRAVADVLRMNRAAWVAWLEHGSREDWAERVGILNLPALIVTGDKDTSLGTDPQQRLTLPHLPNAQLASVDDCGHLIPMEKPRELASLMQSFLESL